MTTIYRFVTVLAVVAVMLTWAGSAGAQSVLNMDWNLPTTDPTYVGDNGILSTTGGTVWNGLPSNVNAVFPIVDQFGGATPVEVEHISAFGGYSESVQPTDLQIGGFAGDTIEIDGLLPGELYDVAFYIGHNSGFEFLESTGGFIVFAGGNPLTGVPGVANNDYILVQNVMGMLYDQGQKFGFVLTGFDGQVLGMQISGVVPEPASLALLGLGGLAILRRRR